MLAIVLVYSTAIAVHECGHYISIKATGIPVTEVCLGEGPVLIETHLPDGATLRLHALPFSGYVQPSVTHMRQSPPSRMTGIIIYSAGVMHTTIWSCVLFTLFAAFSGLGSGFWRSLWFGLRRSFIMLLVFPFQASYGVLTFQSYGMISRSWPIRMVNSFLLADLFQHDENGRQTVLPHGAVQWIGMFAVVFLLCSVLGMIPVSMDSDPAMMFRLAMSFVPSLQFDAMTALLTIQMVIAAVVFLFLLQSLLLVLLLMLKRRLDAREERDNQEE